MVKTKVSKVEEIKERSNFLREPVASELKNDLNYFSQDAIQVLKFHGSYQQDNRDNRVRGEDKDYSMMLRTRNPGGIIEAPLFLALDRLSTSYGNDTLRVTTRQGFQIHGILKSNLKNTIAEIVKCMGSTLGACGDLNRNVMAPPAPFKEKAGYEYARQYAKNIADLLTPQTRAYYDIWLDGEKAVTVEEDEAVVEARQRNSNGTNFDKGEEPIYGTQYLPRKFKCCVTVPGDNSVDIYTHDLSLVVITNRSNQLEGFNVLVGGGLGRTHRKEETFARLAEPLGFVPKDKIYDLVKSIISVQRDYGNRSQRRVSRMKYLINDWGIKKFKKEVEKYLGSKVEKFRELPPWEYKDYLGWHEQEDGKYFVGIPVENGRVKDDDDIKNKRDGDGKVYLKTALRKICQQFRYPMLLTGNHNIVIYNVVPEFKSYVDNILTFHNVVFDPEQLDPITRYSMACPALPTCGLAMTESERILPSVNSRIRALLTKLDMADLPLVVRMTGCPNGCARPYMAELGFVGSDRDAYQVWLGGTPNQTTLAQPITDKMRVEELESFLEPIFVLYRDHREGQESFGEFCNRFGLEQIRTYLDNPITKEAEAMPDPSEADSTSTPKKQTKAKTMAAKDKTEKSSTEKKANKDKDANGKGRKIRYRVGVHDEMYDMLKDIAAEEEKSMTQLVDEALNSYLDSRKK